MTDKATFSQEFQSLTGNQLKNKSGSEYNFVKSAKHYWKFSSDKDKLDP